MRRLHVGGVDRRHRERRVDAVELAVRGDHRGEPVDAELGRRRHRRARGGAREGDRVADRRDRTRARLQGVSAGGGEHAEHGGAAGPTEEAPAGDPLVGARVGARTLDLG